MRRISARNGTSGACCLVSVLCVLDECTIKACCLLCVCYMRPTSIDRQRLAHQICLTTNPPMTSRHAEMVRTAPHRTAPHRTAPHRTARERDRRLALTTESTPALSSAITGTCPGNTPKIPLAPGMVTYRIEESVPDRAHPPLNCSQVRRVCRPLGVELRTPSAGLSA